MTICVICWEDCNEPKLNCACKGDGNGIVHLECLKKMEITQCPLCRQYLRDEFERRVFELFAIVLIFLFQNKKTEYNYRNAIDKLLRNQIIKEKIWAFLEMIIVNPPIHGFKYPQELVGFKVTCLFMYDLDANTFSRTVYRKTNNRMFFSCKRECKIASLEIEILNPTKVSKTVDYFQGVIRRISNKLRL
jgi:hypothetical protein